MNLLRTLGTISSLTLVSRILAFARDILIARVFGAGMATDAFFVAFKLPNLLRREKRLRQQIHCSLLRRTVNHERRR